MTFLEHIKHLCKEKGVTVSKMEKEIGISKGGVYKWNTSSPSQQVLIKLSNYFGVSVDSLVSGKVETKEWQPTITDKDEKDIKKILDALKNQLSTGTGLMYDGEPMNEEDMEYVLQAVEALERNAKLAAKKKFTPKKYQK